MISNLLKAVKTAATFLLEFLFSVALGLLAALLFVLPWLLRLGAVLIWLVAGYMGITSIQAIYAPFSPAIPLFALQFGMILSLVSWVGILIRKSRIYLWGGLTAGGLLLGGLSIGARWLSVNWVYATLFFHILPAALFALLLMVETLRLRAIHQGVGPRIHWMDWRAKFQKDHAG